MVNINKLKGKIVENGLTIRGLAASIGIDPSTLYRKIGDGGETFTIGEVKKIAEVLSLSADEATNIFFDRYVA